MRKQARYAAFLSYADPDKSLVQELAKLFGQFNEQVFFAKVNLPMSGTPEWRRAIAEAVKESASFVHICTRHSLRRPWVLYESGVADACAIPRFAARVSNVARSGGTNRKEAPQHHAQLLLYLQDEQRLMPEWNGK
jgi:hypothetical protein